MKIKYANEFIQNTGLGHFTTFVYQFIFGENVSNDKKIILYFIMYGLEFLR